MASVEVDRDDFLDGTLPVVCALTGTEADEWLAVRSSRLPLWWPALLLLGAPGWAAVAVVYALREPVDGRLPIRAAAWERHRRHRRAALRRFGSVLGWGAGAVVVAAFVVAQAESLPVAALPWLLLVLVAVAGFVALLMLPDALWARPRVETVSGGRVKAEQVHADFVAAVEAQRRARRGLGSVDR